MKLRPPFQRFDLVEMNDVSYVVIDQWWCFGWWVKLTFPLCALVPYVGNYPARSCTLKQSYQNYLKEGYIG